ncbi:MAG: dihydrofolate reductase [Anaerolineales bacterium]|nr:dihydrofolate reductase [Anaerolineales bacterium]
MVSIIVAADEGNGIGLNGAIPWHLSSDLKRFKTLTMGHHLVMGRRTYESIDSTLPGRRMIVLSRDPEFQAKDCQTARSLQESFQLAMDAGEREVFVIGGAEVFSEALVVADHLYLTRVHCTQEADTIFPPLNEENWMLICEQFHPADELNQFPQTFAHYIKKLSRNLKD